MTNPTDLIVDKQQFDNVQLIEPLPIDTDLMSGQVLVEVEQFGLTANNISYAGAGDMLGYWAFFPGPEPGWGRVPVWGFAHVVRSEHADVPVGERIFGFLPMARRFVMQPNDVSDLCWSDHVDHRTALHPWYNRYYRTVADPVTKAGHEDVQPVAWALFMTGWEIARTFAERDNFGADAVVIGSASSNTAVACAHTFAAGTTGIQVSGITSAANEDLVRSYGCYDTVMTYDSLDLESIDGQVAIVDMSGNARFVTELHTAFAGRLVQSYGVGATHRTARDGGGPLAGPQPEFFFIPNVAEERAAALGHAAYHAEFASAWATYAPWISGFKEFRREAGPEAIEAAFLDALNSGARATEAVLLTFE